MKQYVSKFSGKELDERLTKVDNIPTKTSELNNDSGFISEAEADNKYTDKNKTDVLEGGIKNIKNKIDDLENNLLKKETFEINVIDGYISRLHLPKKNTILHNLYENIKYNLYINIPFIKDDESIDGEFTWKIIWDGEGNLEIQEVNKELLLPEHFEIYQYVENNEIPTKISQLENDKNYITDSEVQNKLNNLNNIVDYFGDIIELSITSKGGNIDSVEVNEGILVDTLLTKANLDENGKIVASQIPDYLLGQVMFGGLIYVNNSVIPTENFDAKYGPFFGQNVVIDIHDYDKYEGVYFIALEDGIILDIDVKVGDWIVSTGYSWEKIDNTDAVSSVAGLVGNVNASALAAVLADLADSNSLARKTDVPKKLSQLENDIEIEVYGDRYIESEVMGYGTYLTTNVAENLDEVSARGQLADAYDIKTFVENAVQGGGGDPLWQEDLEGRAFCDRDIHVDGNISTSSTFIIGSIGVPAPEGGYRTGDSGQILKADGNGFVAWDDLSIPTKVSDLENDNIYITDFKVEDLELLVIGHLESLQIDGQALTDALYEGKRISVPYTSDTIGGHAILLGEVSDTDIYFTVYTHQAKVFYCEAIEGVIYNWGIWGRDVTSTVEQTELGDLKNIAIANAVQTGSGNIYAFPGQANGDEDDVLLSRGMMKTINGQYLLADENSNDITVAYPEKKATSTAMILQPNTVTVWVGTVTGTIQMAFALPLQGYVSEYIARFTVGSEGVQLIVPDNVVWADSVLPAMTPGKTYEISFLSTSGDNSITATFLEF